VDFYAPRHDWRYRDGIDGTMNRLLLILFSVAAASVAVATVRLQSAAREAATARNALADCRLFLADAERQAAAASLGLIGGMSAQPGHPTAHGLTDMESRIRAAGSVAGVAEELTSVEIAEPVGSDDTGVRQTKVFLHFEALSLEALTRFLQHLAGADPDFIAQMIELGPPDGDDEGGRGGATSAPAVDAERWSVDVTLVYRDRSAAQRQPS